MNRIMTGINFFGVVAVGVLCLLQWGQIGRLQNDAVVAARNFSEQADALSKEQQAHKADAADAADLRDRLAASQAAAEAGRVRAVTAEQNVAVLTANVDRLKAAVAERDAVLEKQQQAVRQLVAERNDAVTKYNQVVTKYNDLAKQAGG